MCQDLKIGDRGLPEGNMAASVCRLRKATENFRQNCGYLGRISSQVPRE